MSNVLRAVTGHLFYLGANKGHGKQTNKRTNDLALNYRSQDDDNDDDGRCTRAGYGRDACKDTQQLRSTKSTTTSCELSFQKQFRLLVYLLGNVKVSFDELHGIPF